MRVTFHGAAGEVTGSMHLLADGRDRILLDCGLFQGRRKESDRKNRTLPFDPSLITNIVLSHAHIDHSGRLPVLTRSGFGGRVICTRATADASRYLLLDSAHIQESDALYLNYKTVRSFLYTLTGGNGQSPRKKRVGTRQIREIKQLLKKGRHELNAEAIDALLHRHRLAAVEPLYTQAEAEAALEFLEGYPYLEPVTVGRGLTCRFYDAGHILGSAFCLIKQHGRGRHRNILYTGDVGRFHKPIIKNPTLRFAEEDRDIDLLVMETTYGDRLHEPVKQLKPQLAEVLCATHARGGSLVVPAFAFGRTQEILYILHELYRERAVPRLPVYVDSPLASNLTRVFGEHPEVYNQEMHRSFLTNRTNPFSFRQIRFVQSLEESMALMAETRPNIVIAGSGMCEAGRVVHHLRYKIHDERNAILIVGFMAENTLGRRIVEAGRRYEEHGRMGPAPVLRFLNKEYPLKARVAELGGFSAHGDRKELLRLVKGSNLRIKKIALVHGEVDQTRSFAELLRSEGYRVVVPRRGETVAAGSRAT